MAAAVAATAAAGSSSGGGVFVEEEGEFSEREVEVAAILAGLQSVVRARFGGQRRRPEIPSWGRRRRRTVPAAGKPVGVAAAGDSRGQGAASPDTPLAFPEDQRDDDDDDEEEQDDEAAAEKKARAHEEWVQEQRGVVASLSHENAHLLKQIEEFKARLQSSKSTNDSLKKIQSKHKKRPWPRREENDEEERKRKLQAHAAAASADRPALGLDLNEPVAESEPVAAAQWCHHRGQMSQHKAALTAAARRRRQLIRRAKAAARRAGRGA